MSYVWVRCIIFVIIGVLINFLIIRPIERKRYRKICIEEGLISKTESENKNEHTKI